MVSPRDFSGYPSAECPECGGSDTAVTLPVHPDRDFGPGEWATYGCHDCYACFDAIVPEPPDRYEGDGVFAENH